MLQKEGFAEIISIGDELLIGQVVNSNAAWMGEQLFSSGIALRRVVTIGDVEADLHAALDEAIERAQFIFFDRRPGAYLRRYYQTCFVPLF